VFWVDLADIDFAPGSPVTKLAVSGGAIFAGNTAAKFEVRRRRAVRVPGGEVRVGAGAHDSGANAVVSLVFGTPGTTLGWPVHGTGLESRQPARASPFGFAPCGPPWWTRTRKSLSYSCGATIL